MGENSKIPSIRKSKALRNDKFLEALKNFKEDPYYHRIEGDFPTYICIKCGKDRATSRSAIGSSKVCYLCALNDLEAGIEITNEETYICVKCGKKRATARTSTINRKICHLCTLEESGW